MKVKPRPITKLTNRAMRYRANHPSVRPKGPKICAYCGSRRNIGVDHVDGHEENAEPHNLLFACKSCNGTKASVFRRAGLGRRVNQRNPPTTGRTRTIGLKEYGDAIKVMRGAFDGDVSAAVQTVQDASPSVRSEYTRQSWAARKALYGPSGRAGSELPF